jgi:hypothetical protein
VKIVRKATRSIETKECFRMTITIEQTWSSDLEESSRGIENISWCWKRVNSKEDGRRKRISRDDEDEGGVEEEMRNVWEVEIGEGETISTSLREEGDYRGRWKR